MSKTNKKPIHIVNAVLAKSQRTQIFIRWALLNRNSSNQLSEDTIWYATRNLARTNSTLFQRVVKVKVITEVMLGH